MIVQVLKWSSMLAVLLCSRFGVNPKIKAVKAKGSDVTSKATAQLLSNE